MGERTEGVMESLTAMDASRSRTDCSYVRGAEGTFYMEVPRPEGGFEYIAAEKGLAFRELPNSKWIAVRDIAEANRQSGSMSHINRFWEEKDGKMVRQHTRSLDSFGKMMQQFSMDRVDPGSSPNVKQVTDAEFEGLMAMYQQARAELQEAKCEFRPLNTYAHRLITRSGKVIRPLLKGEIGMIGPTILTLEKGYGTGNTVRVGVDIGERAK
jgi:hypothetical protein